MYHSVPHQILKTLSFAAQIIWIDRDCREKAEQGSTTIWGKRRIEEAFEKIVRGHDTFSSVLKISKTSQRKNEQGFAGGTAELLAEHWIDVLEIEGYKIQYREPSWLWRVF